jgi:hypothetical protein
LVKTEQKYWTNYMKALVCFIVAGSTEIAIKALFSSGMLPGC